MSDLNLTRRSFVATAAASAALLGTLGATAGAAEASKTEEEKDDNAESEAETEAQPQQQVAETDDGLPTVADVVVVGGGAAGFAALDSAMDEGYSAIIIEAAEHINKGSVAVQSGGNIAYIDDDWNNSLPRNEEEAAAYLDIDESEFDGAWAEDLATVKSQVAEWQANPNAGRFDSIEAALVDHFRACDGVDQQGVRCHLDHDLIRASLENSKALADWMEEDGLALGDSMVAMRTWYTCISHCRGPVNNGLGLMNALRSRCRRLGGSIQPNTRGVQLLLEDGRVTGVRAITTDGQVIDYHANKGVVLATGWYCSDGGFISKYQQVAPACNETCGHNQYSHTLRGDGITMAQRLGAEVRDLQFVQGGPSDYYKSLSDEAASSVNEQALFFVNKNGQRFCDDTKASNIDEFVVNQPDTIGIAAGDLAMAAALETANPGCLDQYEKNGWLFQGDTIEEVAEKAGMSPIVLRQTVNEYNAAADGAEDKFGRTEFAGKMENSPFILAITSQVAFTFTFGGLVIDEDSHVLTTAGEPIPGLYAAGATVNGFEGRAHWTGDCLTVCIHTGYRAGKLL